MLGKALTTAAAGNAGGEGLGVEDVFQTWLYTGNGSTQTITNGIDLAGKGGLVWQKPRSGAGSHILTDTARGVDKFLVTDDTNPSTDGSGFGAQAFYSTGFGSSPYGSGTTVASWTFRKQAKFFDVVTYVGNGSSNTQVINHSLGSVPGCMIVKRLDAGSSWVVYHRSLSNTEYLRLNATDLKATDAAMWYSTTPTATNFTIGGTGDINTLNGSYVVYLFAHDAGGFGSSGNDNVISCGSYTGNGSAAGPTITLGWEPQWVMIKRVTGSSTNANWLIYDVMRGAPVGADAPTLYANLSDAEIANGGGFSAKADGFQIYASDGHINASGSTYIYIAIRRGPMKTPTDATKVFSMVDRAGTGATATVSGFSNLLDALIVRGKVNGYPANFYDRLRGATRLLDSSSTGAEVTNANTLTGFDEQTGYKVGSDNFGYGINYAAGGPYINWGFRRAPGFFDVVAYTGTGVARTVSHNLGVVPELMIVKRREDDFWMVYESASGATKAMLLNSTNGAFAASATWNNTAPTSSVFTVGTASDVNASGGTYIAYLFASCPGVSKVGSYTGTANTLQINCGFTSGARFVLIKRTDSTGDWYVWDSARGIVAGNDPYLLINSPAPEVTNTDYIDPYSAGFEISSTAPAAINANGGTYLYLAIA